MAQPIVNSRLSTAATLLRNSRLFALPTPIQAANPLTSAKPQGWSDSATSAYPTHAAIQTLDSSRSRGDWGVKRPLPLRSTTRSGNPIIRINGVDTIDHITDYSSASAHTITLEKWQSLNPVIKVPHARFTLFEDPDKEDKGPSVFEKWVDNTQDRKDYNPAVENVTPGHEPKRWVFSGPWIAGQRDYEFTTYLEKKVRPRKAEFRQFVRERFIQQELYNQRRISQERGDESSPQKITPAQFRTHLKSLRNDPQLLGRLIHQFLDLPPSPRVEVSDYSAIKDKDRYETTSGNIGTIPASTPYYATHGPPITHPSAGFSYLRTRAHTPNHPLLGPQLNAPPIEARILQSKSRDSSAAYGRAIVGVAGLTSHWSAKFSGGSNSKTDVGIEKFDPDVPGGSKIWVNTSHVKVDSQGKLLFHVSRADQDAVAIQTAGKQVEVVPEPEVKHVPTYYTAATQLPMLSGEPGKPAGQQAPPPPPSPSNYGIEEGYGRGAGNVRTRYEYAENDNGLSEGARGLLDILPEKDRKGLL
jgi:hypothetical protein